MPSRTIIDDYYAVLGVDSTADKNTLTAAWRQLVRTKHPDKNPGNPNATVEFQLLESAYFTLSDPSRRRAYDHLRFISPLDSRSRRTNEYCDCRHIITAAEQPTPPPRLSPYGHSSMHGADNEKRHALVALLAEKATQKANIARQRRRINAIRRDMGELMDVTKTNEGDQVDSARSLWARIGVTIQNIYGADQQTARQYKAEELTVQLEALHELEKHLQATEERIHQLEASKATPKRTEREGGRPQ
ncbi:DnaJ-domain-containing protein [Hypoxylon sp. FL0543]|nr:DnaJ-domain-containing protein [Hypoxylon sp. FL0543]